MNKITYFFWRLRETYWGYKQFFLNVYKFRKELSNFYSWNYDLGFLRKTIEENYNHISKYGHEESISKNKKLLKMERAIQILKNFEQDSFLDLAEDKLNLKFILRDFEFEALNDGSNCSRLIDNLTEEEQQINSQLIHESSAIEIEQWNELWGIIKGQDRKELKTLPKSETSYSDWFDGSGLQGWWN